VYVNVKNGFCSKVAKVDLVIADPIVVSIAQPGQISCTNSTVILDATASTYPAGSVFSWVASAGGTIYSNPNTLTPTVSSAGTYTLTISRNYQPGDTTCSGSAAVNVTANLTKPVTQVTTTKTKICKGESVTLTATGGVTYNWTTIAGTGAVQTVSPSVTTTFTVYAIGANGCSSINPATIKIEVVQPPISTLPAIAGQICTGDQIVLDAGAPPAGSNQTYTYLWDSGETTQTITTGVVGPHTVTIKNGTCSKSFTTQVVQAVPPTIKSIEYNNNTLSLWAYNPSNGPLQYSIDGGFTWQDSNIFTNVQNNVKLIIKVKLKNTSCESTLEYFTFFMSNVITPNGDGVNDVIDFTGISVYKDFSAGIFDRYGTEIFKTAPNRLIWDGKFQTRTLPTATYWYKINYEDPASKEPVSKTGWIMLKNRE
jgi:gliding motility-associated-like protein